MSTNIRLKTLLLAGVLLTPLSANADKGFYLGAGIGSADLNEDFDGLQIDTDSTAFRVTAGWSFNDNFAVEVGYQGFGNFEQQVIANSVPLRIGLSADGYTVGIAGQLPVAERFFLTGRLGAFFWDGSAEINGVSQADPGDSNLYFGAGAKYAISTRFHVLADYSRFDLEEAKSNMFSLGFQYHFGN